MEIKIMQHKLERNAVNKNPTALLTLAGTLKQDTSIINPVITVEADVATLALANYLSIPDFKRFYYITDIRSVRNKLVEISAHVDVLYSFKDSILANSAIILRQENDWNLYLNDGSFTVYQNPNIVTKEFPNGFTTQEFVLAVAGQN